MNKKDKNKYEKHEKRIYRKLLRESTFFIVLIFWICGIFVALFTEDLSLMTALCVIPIMVMGFLKMSDFDIVYYLLGVIGAISSIYALALMDIVEGEGVGIVIGLIISVYILYKGILYPFIKETEFYED